MKLRDKPGLPRALTALAARLPWWLALVLAVLSYALLHPLASRPAPPLHTGHGRDAALWALAWAGQYALAALFGLGAMISGWRRAKRARLHASAARSAQGLKQMSWQDFEVLVGEYFRREGFGVLDNGGGGADGGVDVVLRKGDAHYLVQCKHWRVLRVGVQPVRELYGVMAAHGAAGGFVVTSGDFTEDAVHFADGLALTLVNGQALRRGLRAQQGAGPDSAPPKGAAPGCPLCGAPMVLRQARQGATAGKQFWGCSRFAQTRCRGTREINQAD
ncbi:MAG: restriction endonuclease [Polaromonas sp.]